MTTVAWFTDLHLDRVDAMAPGPGSGGFPPLRVLPEVEIARFVACVGAADAVLVTGDISWSGRVAAHVAVLADAVAVPFYYVLGNHDFYNGSFADVVAAAARPGRARYLPAHGVAWLASGVALVGADGWYDGGHGGGLARGRLMPEYQSVRELRGRGERARSDLLVARARGEAAAAAVRIDAAVAAGATTVYVATHVPPFPQAARAPDGRPSAGDWLPVMTSKAMGDALTAAAATHRGVRIEVLCGHTHTACELRIPPNLRCRVGFAEYGRPWDSYRAIQID